MSTNLPGSHGQGSHGLSPRHCEFKFAVKNSKTQPGDKVSTHEPYTLHLKPYTLHPKPYTLHPKP